MTKKDSATAQQCQVWAALHLQTVLVDAPAASTKVAVLASSHDCRELSSFEKAPTATVMKASH